MSLHRSHHHLTVGRLKLAAPIPSLLEETGLQAMLEELPGVSAVEFPQQDGIEVKYDPNLVGERSFYHTVRSAGYVPAEFGLL